MFSKIKQWINSWKKKRQLNKKLAALKKHETRSYINKTSKLYIYSCIQI